MAPKFLAYFVIIFVSAHCFVVVQEEKNNSATTNKPSVIVPEKYIAGGYPVKIGLFAWIARLTINVRSKLKEYNCGGSLIRPRYVLTAAHCLYFTIAYYDDIDIYLNEYDKRTFPRDCSRGKCPMALNQLVHPDNIMMHEDYDNATFANDIALLRLEKEVPLSVIPLPPFDIDQPENNGMAVAVFGWGQTENSKLSDILLATVLSLIPKEECDRRAFGVPTKDLCAGDNKGGDTCKGDSGGPLLMYHNNTFYISGIVSYGYDVTCGTANIGYYTNVFKYMNWIEGHINEGYVQDS